MDIDVTFSGYRCFSPRRPVTLSLRGDRVALIGVNNSGKSTLLKGLYEFRNVFSDLSQLTGMMTTTALEHGAPFRKMPETGDVAEIFWHFGETEVLIEVTLPSSQTEEENADTEGLAPHVQKAQIRVATGAQKYFVAFHALRGWTTSGSHVTFSQDGNLIVDRKLASAGRMLRAFEVLSECFYFPSVRHVSPFTPPEGRHGKFYDIDSGKTFIENWATHQQGAGKLSTQLIRAVTIDIKKIFRYNDLEIHADTSRHDLQVVADGMSMRLGELGTGLSQFLLLLGNIAFAKPSYVLIDEPETNLHPSLQLQFMRSVASRAKLGVVFATHSLGLARQAADRIFVLTRSGEDVEMTELRDTPNLAQIVGELSFGRADSLGTRALLLVEGPNDIMTFETLLSAFVSEHKFAILSLGGRNAINSTRERELEHIIAINPNVVAVIDSERGAADEALGPERSGFTETCRRLNIQCHVLKHRAIENYFTENAILAACPKAPFRGLSPYESYKEAKKSRPLWEKKDNWRIASRMLKSEIDSSDLGRILKALKDFPGGAARP